MITETRPGQRIPAEEYEVIVDAFGRGVPVRELAEDYAVSPSRLAVYCPFCGEKYECDTERPSEPKQAPLLPPE